MRDSLFRVSLKAVIRNERGEVLVVKERGDPEWNLPGGGMDHGETYYDAMARELFEEVGYEGEFTMRLITAEEAKPLASRDIWQIEETIAHIRATTGI